MAEIITDYQYAVIDAIQVEAAIKGVTEKHIREKKNSIEAASLSFGTEMVCQMLLKVGADTISAHLILNWSCS